VEASYPNRQEKDVYSQTLECAQFSPVQVSPEMRSVAIAESKKWLEEKKKSAPSSSKTIELGTCKLNTNTSLFVCLSLPFSPLLIFASKFILYNEFLYRFWSCMGASCDSSHFNLLIFLCDLCTFYCIIDSQTIGPIGSIMLLFS
jgi:hypothetical protein